MINITRADTIKPLSGGVTEYIYLIPGDGQLRNIIVQQNQQCKKCQLSIHNGTFTGQWLVYVDESIIPEEEWIINTMNDLIKYHTDNAPLNQSPIDIKTDGKSDIRIYLRGQTEGVAIKVVY